MDIVRSIIFYVAWALWTGLFGLAIPLLWLIGSPAKVVRLFSRVWARGILSMLSVIVGLKYTVSPSGFVPSRPSLIISNHQSMWETLAALILFPDVAIVAKRELLRIPVMGWYLRHSPMILIDRDDASNALRQMVEQSQTAVAAGRSVLIFPEGTRQRVKAPIKFKRGVELLYRMLGVPSIPVVVNSGRFWGVGSGPLRAGVITVAYLEPVDPKLRSRDFIRTIISLMETEKAIIDHHF